ncbi:MAG: Ferrous-iron efflux pump FieF [Candidatus Heimdallarchaeota archaeon LC_3]|nr:MAG: Ferrous-iron efflux pump FieF [Candidatus Heimdallarchaeota archaeon LC_3]
MAASIYWALIGNFIISLAKFAAGFLTNSASMISEGYHSLSDTINQVLLVIGIKRSERKPDKRHPFGYSQAQFFWGFIVAIMIFGLAGGLSFVHGFEKLFEPHPSVVGQDYLIVYVILVISFIIEGFVLNKAYKEVRALQQRKEFASMMKTLENMGDPALLTILIEDSLALIGIVIAFVATLLTDITHDVSFDGLGSVLIGLVLMVGGLILARENKSYLIGRAIRRKDQEKIVAIINESEYVKEVTDLRSMLLGPDDMIISLEVDFDDNLDTEDIEKLIDELESAIIKVYPTLSKRKIFIEPN